MSCIEIGVLWLTISICRPDPPPERRASGACSDESFRRSSTRKAVDALLGIRRRGDVPGAGTRRRFGRAKVSPGEVHPDGGDGEEQ